MQFGTYLQEEKVLLPSSGIKKPVEAVYSPGTLVQTFCLLECVRIVTRSSGVVFTAAFLAEGRVTQCN
jgi:hypothetical protein